MLNTQDAERTQPETVADRVREAESLLAQGLIAINQGLRLEAMEDLYAASCVLEHVRAALETPTRCAEK